jgi:hypothetical protein
VIAFCCDEREAQRKERCKMAIVGYHDAVIPAGGRGQKRKGPRSRGFPKMRVAVGSPGGTVTLEMWRADGKGEQCNTEMTVTETKKLIEGLLDALQGRCGMTREKRNRFCRQLEIHPE